MRSSGFEWFTMQHQNNSLLYSPHLFLQTTFTRGLDSSPFFHTLLQSRASNPDSEVPETQKCQSLANTRLLVD